MDRDRYETRINRALALIDRHIDQDLSIERLAGEACLSPFHFHRIFSTLTGESVHAVTTRMRMERALALARRAARPQWKAIAPMVGYRSQDVFTRAFKRHFGCTPGAFDLEQYWQDRPDREDAMAVSRYFLRPALPLPEDFTVEIIYRPASDLIISRAMGGYLDPARIVSAYQRIEAFAQHSGIAMPGRLAGASRDDPELVPLSRCRYDFVLEVHEGTAAPKGFKPARREGRPRARAASASSRAAFSPAASGVPPPPGRSASDRRARASDRVGGNSSSAARPRNATSATCARLT